MVGSDDEVEVARQERWLQRIREQFDAEHDSAEAAGAHAGYDVDDSAEAAGAHAGYDADDSAPLYNGNGVHPNMANEASAAQPVRNGHQAYGRYEARNFEPDARNGHHINGHHPATGHPAEDPGVVDAVVDDDSGWLPAERSWLTGDPDGVPDDHTGTQDTWAQVAADPYTAPAAQGPTPQAEQWPTSDWEAASRTQRWDAAPVDTGQQAAWPADHQGQETSTWNLPAPGPTGGGSAPAQDAGWREAHGDEPDVWSDPDPAAHEEWAEIMPSQPPAQTWGAPAPQPRDGWHDPVPAPGTGVQQPWQPVQHADPAATNGYRNGAHMQETGYDRDHVQETGYDRDHAQETGYDRDQHTGYREHVTPTDAGHEHYGSYGGTGEPAQPADGSTSWSVGATDTDGYDGGDERRGWDDDVVAEPQPLDIWAPAEEETWAPPANDQTWTPAHPPPTHTHAFGGDPSQTGPFETIDPAPPDADRTAAWSVDPSPPVDDDPYRPEPRPGRRYTDTTTDPFEALQSLQSQLNRLGGNGRRPPRRYEE